jgi:hypothetical protein
MPQLKRCCSNQEGSALLPVIAVTVLLSFAIGGFLGVARNNVNQEVIALVNDKAFLAAESGLLMGTRWLRDSANWRNYKTTGYPGTVYNGAIDGFQVSVAVTAVDAGALKIQSTATQPALSYSKVLSWTVREAVWSNPGIFINDCSQAGDVGGTGLNNEWFDGPLHANSPIYISSVSGGNVNVKFVNGSVTTHNKTAKVSFDDGGNWGAYGTSQLSGNNYDFGIWHHDAQTGQYSKIDPFFNRNGSYSTFRHSQDSLYIPRITTQTLLLPVNQSADKTAILDFYTVNGTGKADYFYYAANGTQNEITFNVNQQIVRAANDIKVLGTVKGQVTVVTDSGFDINPVGDLTYANYQPSLCAMDGYDNSGNYGLGSYGPLNNDVLALVSGGDINFGLDKYTLSGNENAVSLAAVEAHGNTAPTMVVTAQLMATEKGCGIRWQSTRVNDYNYKLRALGTRAVDVYKESHNAQGGPGSDAFRFYYDTRFSHGLNAPGVQTARSATQNGELFILNTDWSEENSL